MSRSQNIAQHLQYLRRFARALTGNQASGDAYVAAVLEAIIADPDIFDESGDPRVECYRVLCALWDSIDLNRVAGGEPEAWEQLAGHKLDTMTPRARQAFLLNAVESFTPEQIARILDEDIAAVHELLRRASEDIARQIRTQIMIIEDEPLIALDIEMLVSELGHGVTGVARTHAEAVALAKERPPGMVLADIQLADGSSGLEAVNEILGSFRVPVVFITAYPEKLLTGERPEPAFLLTKPFAPEMVKGVISQALFFETRAGNVDASA